MKALLTATFALAATAAAAHPGHVGPEAGHTHGEVFALLALIGIAGLLWTAVRR